MDNFEPLFGVVLTKITPKVGCSFDHIQIKES